MGYDGCLPGHFDVLQRSLSTTFRRRGKTFYSSTFILGSECVCVCVCVWRVPYLPLDLFLSALSPSLSHPFPHLLTSNLHHLLNLATLLFCTFSPFFLFLSVYPFHPPQGTRNNLFFYFGGGVHSVPMDSILSWVLKIFSCLERMLM